MVISPNNASLYSQLYFSLKLKYLTCFSLPPKKVSSFGELGYKRVKSYDKIDIVGETVLFYDSSSIVIFKNQFRIFKRKLKLWHAWIVCRIFPIICVDMMPKHIVDSGYQETPHRVESQWSQDFYLIRCSILSALNSSLQAHSRVLVNIWIN